MPTSAPPGGRRSRLVQPVEAGSLVVGAEEALPGEAVVLTGGGALAQR